MAGPATTPAPAASAPATGAPAMGPAPTSPAPRAARGPGRVEGASVIRMASRRAASRARPPIAPKAPCGLAPSVAAALRPRALTIAVAAPSPAPLAYVAKAVPVVRSDPAGRGAGRRTACDAGRPRAGVTARAGAGAPSLDAPPAAARMAGAVAPPLARPATPTLAARVGEAARAPPAGEAGISGRNTAARPHKDARATGAP